MLWPNAHQPDFKFAEADARHRFLRMTSFKWRLICAFDLVAKLLLSLFPSARSSGKPNAAPETILVMEYWNLGDLAILVPFLRNLRHSFPSSRICLLANPKYCGFLGEENIVDEAIPARVPWAQHFHRWRKYNPFSRDWLLLAGTIFALRKRRFSWAFSGRMDARDNFLLWLFGARRRIGYGFAGGAVFLTDCVPPDLTREHRTDAWLHLLDAVGVTPNSMFGGLQLGHEQPAAWESFFSRRNIPRDAFLIGIHPGARIAARRWGAERFAEVARKILKETGSHILWFSEPGENSEAPLLDRCHGVSMDFRPFLSLLSRCRLLICNDSGPMHLANLLSVPVVAVFGPQRPEWFGPRGPRDRVVIHPEFPCRPCFDYCIFDRPYCLKAISPLEVYAAVQRVLRPNALTLLDRKGVVSQMEELVGSNTGFLNKREVNP